MNDIAHIGRLHQQIVRCGKRSAALAIRAGALLNKLWSRLAHGEKGRVMARLEREWDLRKTTIYDYRRLADAARDFPSLGKMPLWDAYVEAGIHRPDNPIPRESLADASASEPASCLPEVNLPRPVRLRDGSYVCKLSADNWKAELRRLLDEPQLLEQYLEFGLVLRTTGSARAKAKRRKARSA